MGRQQTPFESVYMVTASQQCRIVPLPTGYLYWVFAEEDGEEDIRKEIVTKLQQVANTGVSSFFEGKPSGE